MQLITALIGLEEIIRIKYKYFIEEYNKIKLVDINIYYDPIIRLDNLPKDCLLYTSDAADEVQLV